MLVNLFLWRPASLAAGIAGRLNSFVSLYQSTLDEIGAGDAHIGGDGVAFLAAVLSSAAGFYMLTTSTLALSDSLETSFGQRVSVVGIGLAPIPCACFLYMRLSSVL